MFAEASIVFKSLQTHRTRRKRDTERRGRGERWRRKKEEARS